MVVRSACDASANNGLGTDRCRSSAAADANTGGGVRIGGAWKLAADRQAALEETLKLQSDELASLRLLLERSEAGRREALQEIERLRKLEAFNLLRKKVLAMSVLRAQNRALAADVRASQSCRERDFHERRACVSQQLALDTDRRLGEEKKCSTQLLQRLTAAEEECDEFQRQYNLMEVRSEKAEARAKESEAHAELMRKAKEQKESYFGVLVKERDRVRRELVELKSKVSKGRLRLTSARTAYSNSENCHPNDGTLSPIEKVAEEEKVKLEGFAAPSRIKAQLAKEVALRKQVEAQLEKLEKDNLALRTRYRNLRQRNGP